MESVFPKALSEPVLLDRIHDLIPGWELPKIMEADKHLSHGLGLAAD